MILDKKNKFLLKSIINSSNTIEDAINSLVKSSTRICLIANKDKKLLGILNDGDIRRAIVKGYKMNKKVSEIMNTSPKTLSYPLDFNEINRIKKMDIFQIPIVDKNNRVVGLYNAKSEEVEKKKNHVVIMSGGVGKRLSPYTKKIPKALVLVNNKTLLEIIIEKIKFYGFNNYLFMLRHKSNLIKNYLKKKINNSLNYKCFVEKTPLGTAGSLKLLKNVVKRSFLLINCDIISDLDYGEFLNFHKKTKAHISIAVKEIESRTDFGVIKAKGNRVYDLEEKPIKKININGEIYVIEPKIINLIKKKENIDMISLIKRAIKKNYKVVIYPIYEKWIDVGTPNSLRVARKNV